MKYLILIGSIIILAGCIPNKNQESVLVFAENNTDLNHKAFNRDSNNTSYLEADRKIRLTDRYYVSSLLRDVFRNPFPNKEDAYGDGKLDETLGPLEIFSGINPFQGGCDPYELTRTLSTSEVSPYDSDKKYEYALKIGCAAGLSAQIHNQIAINSTLRQANLLKVCEGIVYFPVIPMRLFYRLNPLLTSKTITNLPAPTQADLIAIYGEFYRSEAPSPAIIEQLEKIRDEEKNTANSLSFNKWKRVILAVCVTPEWQLL